MQRQIECEHIVCQDQAIEAIISFLYHIKNEKSKRRIKKRILVHYVFWNSNLK